MTKQLDLSDFDDLPSIQQEEQNKQLDLSDFDDLPSSDVSMLESGVRGAAQGLTSGFADELVGGVKAIPELLDGTEAYKAEYEKQRDAERLANKLAQEANPATYMTSELASGVGSFFIPGLNVAKAAKGASLATKAIQGAKSGAALGALSGAGYSEGDTAGQVLMDTAIGGTIGAATGGVIPAIPAAFNAAKQLTSPVAKKATGLLTNNFEILEDAGTAAKAGMEGISVVGRKAKDTINTNIEETVKGIVKILNKSKDKASKEIGTALNKMVKSDIPGEALVNDTQALLDQAKKTANDATKEVISNTENKLNEYKKIIQELQVVKGVEAPSSLEEATSKLSQKVREKKIAGEMLNEPITSTPITATTEGDYVKTLLTKPSQIGDTLAEPMIQRVEGNFGRRSLIDLEPKQVTKIVESITPQQAYNLRRELQSEIQSLVANKEGQAASVLSKIVSQIDEKIEPTLTQEGSELLSKGKKDLSNLYDMTESTKSFDDIAKTEAQMGFFKDVDATKEAKRKLSGFTEKAQDDRKSLRSQADRYGFSKDMESLDKFSDLKRIASKGDDQTALSIQGMLGTIGALTLKGSNLAGLSVNKISNLASKMQNTAVGNQLRSIAKEASPAVRGQLIRTLAASSDELAKELDSIETPDLISSASAEPSVMDISKDLQKKATQLRNTPEGDALLAISKESRKEVQKKLIEDYRKSFPQVNISGQNSNEDSIDAEILNHLSTSEGSALNASKSNTIVPGETGVYDDGRGNPTTMYGANLRSPVTRQAYRDLGIDPLTATKEQHGQAAIYNWNLHANYTDKALDQLGLNLNEPDNRKAELAKFLLRDVGYRGGVKSLRSETMADIVQSLNEGNYREFANKYIKTNHFKTGGKPRQQELIKKLQELIKESPGSGVYKPM